MGTIQEAAGLSQRDQAPRAQTGLVEGVALEPQRYPDSVHHPDWPSVVLRPGEAYRWRSEITVTEA